MPSLTQFTFHNEYNVRIIDLNGELWFVASDVASALDYRMASDMTRFLDDDEKGVQNLHTLDESQKMNTTHNVRSIQRGNPNVVIISESGLYSAILKSRKPEAKKFKKWVTSEVLPSIRKTGKYETAKPVVPCNYLTNNDMANIKRLVWHCSSFMDYEDGFSRAVWYALRVKTGMKSPEAFKVEDLQLLGDEFERIIQIIEPYLNARRESEKLLLSRLIRGRGDYESVMKDILYSMRDSVEEQTKDTRKRITALFKRDYNALIERKVMVC